MILNKAQRYQQAVGRLCIGNMNNMFGFSILKDKLTELFADQDFVMKLSSITRIYPEYYSSRMMKLFLQGENSGKYLKYIAKVNRDKEKQQKTQNNNLFL